MSVITLTWINKEGIATQAKGEIDLTRSYADIRTAICKDLDVDPLHYSILYMQTDYSISLPEAIKKGKIKVIIRYKDDSTLTGILLGQ